jgi:hypothetical protein
MPVTATARGALSGQILPALPSVAGGSGGSRLSRAVDGLRRRTVIR